MLRTSLLLLAVTVGYGCEQNAPTVQTTDKPVVAPATVEPGIAAPADSDAKEHAADNSAVNARDNHPAAKTPIDQNENEVDVKITADIRKRVLDQPDFSINARNVKIITADGKVTLRGPVSTEVERDTIKKIAVEVAGDGNVDSQLELAP